MSAISNIATPTRRWTRVSRRTPCPICGQAKGCRLWDDHTVECLRVASPEEIQGALGGWRHRPAHYRTDPQRLFAQPAAERAPVPERDRVYRRLLGELSLNSEHRQHLTRERQLTAAQLVARGYVSWGWGERHLAARLAQELYDLFGSLVLSVPGFILRRAARSEREYLTLSGGAGIFLPVRDVEGRIQGAQIRWDRASPKSGKYGWLSSSSRGGPGSGSPVHVARPLARPGGSGTVWVTEGVLKADIACDRLNAVVVALPGVHAGRAELVPLLEELRGRGELDQVVLALDADYRTNPAVAKARKAIAEQLARAGFPVELADWEPACKGLDDVLLAGGRIRRSAYAVHGSGPRKLLRAPSAPAPAAPRPPTYTLEEARARLKRELLEHLTNAGGRSSDVGLVVTTPPGSGKSTVLTATVNEVLAARQRASVALFVPRHDLAKDDPGRAGWGHVSGRHRGETDPLTGLVRFPCHMTEAQAQLARLRIPAQQGCERCPLLSACQQNAARQGDQPYYHAQFQTAKRATIYPAQHFLTPSLWAQHAAVVLDDVALMDLALEHVEIHRADLLLALRWAEDDLAEHGSQAERLGPAQPLLRLALELLTQAEDHGRRLSGEALLLELAARAAAAGLGLGEVLEAAQAAQEPSPFQGDLTQGLQNVPRRFVRDLVGVLRHELAQLEQGREGFNRRLYAEPSASRPDRFALRLVLRRELPLTALAGKPLVILDASATLEELRQLFPERRWVELSLRLDMPAGVSVTQDVRSGWGKTALTTPQAREEALGLIAEVLQHHPDHEKVGLITHQAFEPFVRQRFPRLKTGHYYGQRGSNEFAQLEALITFGTPSPNPDALLQQAEGLFYHEPPLARAQYLERRTLATQSGPGWTVAVRTYQDARLQALLRTKREDELSQALYRVRPLSVQPSVQQELFAPEDTAPARLGCHIYCFSNLPLEGLKVTRVIQRVEPAAAAPPGPAELKSLLTTCSSQAEAEGPRRKPTLGQLVELSAWPTRQLRGLADELHRCWLSLVRGDFLEGVSDRAACAGSPSPLGPGPLLDRRAHTFRYLGTHRKEPPASAAVSS